jgi:CBS domain-containing protein
VAEAEAIAAARGVRHLLVVEDDDLVGITSTGDLHKTSGTGMVSECMTAPVRTISANATISDAAELMQHCDVGCLPVVAGGLILGMVTRDAVLANRTSSGASF